jgi:hypothetical protein
MPIYAFVHLKKTAGESVRSILRRNFGTRHFDTSLLRTEEYLSAAQLRRARAFFPRLESIGGHQVSPLSDLQKDFPEIRFYTFLRDPVQRVVSFFHFKAVKRIVDRGWRPTRDELHRFLDEVVEREVNGQCRRLARDGSGPAALETLERDIRFVGIVEHFQESMALFRLWVGRPEMEIENRPRNVTASMAGAGSTDALLKAVADMATGVRSDGERLTRIAERNQDDIILYRHAFHNRFEAQRSSLGPGAPGDQTARPPAEEGFSSRLYRTLVTRPFLPLAAKGVRGVAQPHTAPAEG